MDKKDIFRRFLFPLLLLFIFGIVLLAWPKIMPGPESSSGAPKFPHAGLVIRCVDGRAFPYRVEVATTTAQEMYGLMFRHALPPDQGMIFIYEPDQKISMWMKNTYLPLDMLFVRHDGIITKIIANAQPLDLTPLPSDDPVRAVIEINAGEAAKHGIKPGDKVLFPGFDGEP